MPKREAAANAQGPAAVNAQGVASNDATKFLNELLAESQNGGLNGMGVPDQDTLAQQSLMKDVGHPSTHFLASFASFSGAADDHPWRSWTCDVSSRKPELDAIEEAERLVADEGTTFGRHLRALRSGRSDLLPVPEFFKNLFSTFGFFVEQKPPWGFSFDQLCGERRCASFSCRRRGEARLELPFAGHADAPSCRSCDSISAGHLLRHR
jgi:hypothetical protein